MTGSTGAIRETPLSPRHYARNDLASSSSPICSTGRNGHLILDPGFRSPRRLKALATICVSARPDDDAVSRFESHDKCKIWLWQFARRRQVCPRVNR